MPEHRPHSPHSPRTPRSGFPWALLLLVVLAIIAAWYFWSRHLAGAPSSQPADLAQADASLPRDAGHRPATGDADADHAAPADGQQPGGDPLAALPEQATADGTGSPLAPAADEPRYPLPAGEDMGVGGANGNAALATDAGDPSILEALLTLASRDVLARFVNLQDFARRFVVTVDHLPQERVPGQWSALRPIPGPLVIVDDDDGRMVLQDENFRRYDAFVQFAEALDPAAVARIYRHFYPLLQEQYRALGYPRGYLNDRVVEAIDDMLAAPAVNRPIVLVQPRVQYRFEDPSLEALSAGRKIMIRVGPDHAARLQRILRALRAQIVG